EADALRQRYLSHGLRAADAIKLPPEKRARHNRGVANVISTYQRQEPGRFRVRACLGDSGFVPSAVVGARGRIMAGIFFFSLDRAPCFPRLAQALTVQTPGRFLEVAS